MSTMGYTRIAPTSVLVGLLMFWAAAGCNQRRSVHEQHSVRHNQTTSKLVRKPLTLSSIWDELNREPVALNYDPLVQQYRNPTPDGSSPGYIVSWTASGNAGIHDGDSALEALLPAGYVLCAIGARFKPGYLAALHLGGRSIGQDGTLGGLEVFRFGPEPGAFLEAWCETPPGHALTGHAYRLRNANLLTLRCWYRKYDRAARALTGPVYEASTGLQADSPTTERIFTLHDNCGTDSLQDQTFINGIRMHVSHDTVLSVLTNIYRPFAKRTSARSH